MSFFTLLATAIGLSMDAFACSISIGIKTNRARLAQALKPGLYFGGFQAIMPVLGYFAGSSISGYLTGATNILAFLLLLFVGGKMIFEARGGKEEEEENRALTDAKTMLLMAIATSIDALAVGISFAFINANIFASAAVIGIVTFIICTCGVYLGKLLGPLFKQKAETAGGVILILIAIKILLGSR